MNIARPDTRYTTSPSAVGSNPIRPLQAFRALQRLIADKEDTAQVFEIVEALSGDAGIKGYLRMLCSQEGARQAYLAVELAEILENADWLAAFPAGTVGAHYCEFTKSRKLSASGLVEVSRTSIDSQFNVAHPVAWYGRRIRDVHDIWHVLTGYNTDTLGEGCLLGFTYAQTRNRGVGFIAIAGAFELTKAHWHQPYARAILQGWYLGRKAEWLPALDYERLFAEPLVAARVRLRLTPPTIYDSVPLEARGAYHYSDERELRLARVRNASQQLG